MKEQLVIDNLNLVYYVLQQMGLYDQRDEFYDVGLIGLVKAANNYDPSRGVKFCTSATVYIRNQILMEIRDNNQNKRKANFNTISLETKLKNAGDENLTLGDYIASDFDVEKYLIEKEQIQSVIKAIATLDSEEKQLLKYYICDDMTQIEIAKAIGMSQPHVSRLFKKIIKKLQEKVNEGDKQ